MIGRIPGLTAALARPALLVLLAPLALGACARGGGLSASNAWLRLLPGDLPAAGYFVLHNDGPRAATLVGASAPHFASVQLHRSIERDGLQGMVAVDSVPVPPHGEVQFRPGGYHLMLMRPSRTLAVGGTEPVTLHMADGTEVRVDFDIRGPAGTAAQ